MKLGFNLLLWTTHVTDEHWPIIERLKSVGYDGVEVPMFEGTPDHYERLGRRIRGIGLGATGIGVMPGNGKSAVSPDLTDRAGALSHLQWLTDCTAALGGTLAAGPFHQPLGEFTGRGATADEKARVRDVHKQAAQYAAKHGVARRDLDAARGRDAVEMESREPPALLPLRRTLPVEAAQRQGEALLARQPGDVAALQNRILQMRRDHRQIVGVHGDQL